MKKTLIALTLLGSAAGLVQAQTSVTVYGAVDIGVIKTKDRPTAIGRGDNNKLGFKGVEDLGGGLKALFQLEMRFEPDTGTTESFPNRPLFQGQTRVGLQGDFGTIRLGRGLTAAQIGIIPFDPYGAAANRGNLLDFVLAGFNSEPLAPGSAGNRLSNALFYDTPNINGFHAAVTLATKEAITAGNGVTTTPKKNAYSLSGDYANGPIKAAINYETNAINTKLTQFGLSFLVLPELNLIGSFARQKSGTNGLTTKGSVAGLQYFINGAGRARLKCYPAWLWSQQA